MRNVRGDGTRAICLFASGIIPQFSWVLGHRKLKPTSTTTIRSGAALSALPSAMDSSIQTALTDSSLTAKRRVEALHLVHFQPSIRAHHDDLHTGAAAADAAVCISYRRSHGRRLLDALLF